MPKESVKRTRAGKRRGGRRPVSFVAHPDTDQPISGLRFHKPSNRYYRIGEDNTRVYNKRKGLRGVQYQRRAVYEHECWQRVNEPNETVAVPARHPTYDDFGTEITPVASFDAQGRAVNVHYVSQEDLAAYVREQLGDPEKRARFANMVGYPELLNLHALRSPTEPLLLDSVVENYVANKSFKHARQYADLQRSWQLFANAVGVRTLEEIDVPNVQAFARAVYKSGQERTQKTNILHVQSILKYAADVFKDHRERIIDLKADIRRLCAPPKIKTKRQPTPMKSADYRAMLDHCKKHKEKKSKAQKKLEFEEKFPACPQEIFQRLQFEPSEINIQKRLKKMRYDFFLFFCFFQQLIFTSLSDVKENRASGDALLSVLGIVENGC